MLLVLDIQPGRSDFFTETTPGSAGGSSLLESPDTPFVMPVEGWLGMRLANDSATTFDQYDYTLAPDVFLLYLEYTAAQGQGRWGRVGW